MDDLELNGYTPQGAEPPKEPTQPVYEPQEQPQVLTPPEAPRQETEFYAWSGRQQSPEPPVAPRRESPFANSPYVRVTQHTPPEAPQTPPAAPQTPPPMPRQTQPTKPRKPLLPVFSMVACGAVLFLSVTMFLVSNNRLSSLNKDYRARLDAYANRIEQLEDWIASSQIQTPGNPQQTPATNDVPVRVPSAEGVMTPAQVYAQCVKSVVAIDCVSAGRNTFGQYAETSSSGSGFVLSEDGYVVTNYHVVEGSSSIEISMYDGTVYKAKYVGGNEANDIALIKVDAQNLPAVTIGSSSDLVVGDQVAAIGNPLGELASTLTVGYVSAKDRIVTSEGTQINMLQTDAAINPGNSGGPLFNMYGEVVGITSAKYSGTTSSGATIEGIGFAIPTDDVIMMLEDLRTFGYVTGGYLGVSVSEVSEEATSLYGLPQGVLVRDVMPDSCAEKAGMRAQDIIINLAGYEVKNLNGLSRALNKCKAGQEVIVTVYRSGKEVELTVVLDERPQDEASDSNVPAATEPVVTDPYGINPGDGFMDGWFDWFFG